MRKKVIKIERAIANMNIIVEPRSSYLIEGYKKELITNLREE